MQAIARLAMKGPAQAIGLVLVSGAVAWLLPPALYISGGLVALLGMQLGTRQALLVALGATAGLAVLAALTMGGPAAGLASGAALWAPVALLGGGVRQAGAIRAGLYWLAVAAVAGCLLFQVMHGDPQAWWQGVLQDYLQRPELRRALPPGTEPARLAETLAPVMTGAIGVAAVMALAPCLLIGRWWQSVLYRPGAFGAEFRELGFGRPLAVLFAVLLAGAMAGMSVMANLAPVLVVLFAFQGLAVLHALAAAYALQAFWLVLFYAVLVLALPQVSLMLSLIGAADNWVDFRSRARGAGG